MLAKTIKNSLKWGITILFSLLLGWSLWSLSSAWLLSENSSPSPETLHVLNRLSYGPRPGDLKHIQHVGIEQYLHEQLHPETIHETPQLQWQLTLRHWAGQLKFQRSLSQQYGLYPEDKKDHVRQLLENEFAHREAIQTRVLRALLSHHQLQELLVEFWFNHFNVPASTSPLQGMVGSYETAIRPLVLGNFRDLLATTLHQPAMLTYLDNWRNLAPLPLEQGRPGGSKSYNENYARELLELHTLGVDGGYTQADVEALARILTGWGLSGSPYENNRAVFAFNLERHDQGDKVFLGHHIPGEGQAEVEKVLDILVNHPSTAKHIAYKLAQYFVADTPPASLVQALAQTFQTTQGDLRAVLKQLFESQEFWQSESVNSLFKTPYQYVISLLRAVDSNNPNILGTLGNSNKEALGILDALGQLDMPPFGCRSPQGYAFTKSAWLNGGALVQRLSVASLIAKGQLARKSKIPPTALRNTISPWLSTQSKQTIAHSPAKVQSAFLLGSPELMYR